MKHLFFIAAFLLCLSLHPQQEPIVQQPQPPQQTASRPNPDKELLEIVSKLKPDTIVLEIDGQTATWQELFPHIRPAVQALFRTSEESEESPAALIRSIMQRLVARRMFAMEARQLNLLPTPEERKAVEEEIMSNLIQDGRRQTLEQFKASFDLEMPNLLNVSYDDIVNIMFLNKKKFADLQITDTEIELYIRYKKALQEGIWSLNRQREEGMKALAKDPNLQTDEGFKAAAKKYSEGVEGANGGELNYDFTREELAEINDLPSFDWKVGEVTPVMETALVYRIMKILRALPKTTPNEPEKFRVAQILCGKIGETEDLNDREAIRQRLTPDKQKAAIDEYTYSMFEKYKVKTPLFPDGLWKKLEKSAFVNPAELRQKDAPKEGERQDAPSEKPSK